jgi:hypothetical protein
MDVRAAFLNDAYSQGFCVVPLTMGWRLADRLELTTAEAGAEAGAEASRCSRLRSPG